MTQPRTMRVGAVAGERFVYLVESWSDPKHPHRVDLIANQGRGECSCAWWKTRAWPIVRDNKPELRYGEPGSSVCRHLECARLFFLRHFLASIAEEIETPK